MWVDEISMKQNDSRMHSYVNGQWLFQLVRWPRLIAADVPD